MGSGKVISVRGDTTQRKRCRTAPGSQPSLRQPQPERQPRKKGSRPGKIRPGP